MNFQYSNPGYSNPNYTPKNIDFGSVKGTLYDLKNLQERHMEICRRLALGQSKGDIARDLGITVLMVRYVERSTVGSQYLEAIRTGREVSTMSVQEQITELATPALEVIRQTIAGKMNMQLPDKETGTLKDTVVPIMPALRIAAAKDILGRAGYVPPTKVSGEVNVNHNTQSIVEIAKQKVHQERIRNAENVEFSEVEK